MTTFFEAIDDRTEYLALYYVEAREEARDWINRCSLYTAIIIRVQVLQIGGGSTARHFGNGRADLCRLLLERARDLQVLLWELNRIAQLCCAD